MELCSSRPRQSLAMQAGVGDLVDVALERQRHDVGLEAVDDGARLGAGAAVRLLDGDGLAGLLLPVGGEDLVVGFVELAGRIVGDVEDGGVGEGGDREHRAEGGCDGDEAEASSEATVAAGKACAWDLLPLLIPPYPDLFSSDCQL